LDFYTRQVLVLEKYIQVQNKYFSFWRFVFLEGEK